MNSRFADTFYFIALLSVDDEAHGAAVDFSQDPAVRIVTTRWVLAEFADGFAPTSDRESAAILIKALVGHPSCVILPASDEWFSRGLELYGSRLDKRWSLTDCISFLVMEELEINEALTADHHFEQAGFTALLKQDLA